MLRERAKAIAKGRAPIAEAPLRFCERKPSLLPREAAHDLGCGKTRIFELIEEGQLKAFPISGEEAVREHVRVDSASIIELINHGWFCQGGKR